MAFMSYEKSCVCCKLIAAADDLDRTLMTLRRGGTRITGPLYSLKQDGFREKQMRPYGESDDSDPIENTDADEQEYSDG